MPLQDHPVPPLHQAVMRCLHLEEVLGMSYVCKGCDVHCRRTRAQMEDIGVLGLHSDDITDIMCPNAGWMTQFSKEVGE